MTGATPQPFTIRDRHGRAVTGAKPVLEMAPKEYAAARGQMLRETADAEARDQDAADLLKIEARFAKKREG